MQKIPKLPRKETALLTLTILVSGIPAKQYQHHGVVWIKARPCHKFAIVMQNLSNGRIAVVPSIDGRSISTGQPSQYDDAGYIIAPRKKLVVHSWDIGCGEGAEFFFTDVRAAQGGAQGDAYQMGEIKCVVFRERHSLERPAVLGRRGHVQRLPDPGPFVRATGSPDEQHIIRYGTLADLLAIGVRVQDEHSTVHYLNDARKK